MRCLGSTVRWDAIEWQDMLIFSGKCQGMERNKQQRELHYTHGEFQVANKQWYRCIAWLGILISGSTSQEIDAYDGSCTQVRRRPKALTTFITQRLPASKDTLFASRSGEAALDSRWSQRVFMIDAGGCRCFPHLSTGFNELVLPIFITIQKHGPSLQIYSGQAEVFWGSFSHRMPRGSYKARCF